jgi:hypothetical protein
MRLLDPVGWFTAAIFVVGVLDALGMDALAAELG